MLSKQHKEDGGWGESVEACALKTWTPDPRGSNVVNTAWGMLTVMRIAKSLRSEVDMSPLLEEAKNSAQVASEFLIKTQEPNGNWPQQDSISGVFNKTCGITYTCYRNSFTTWALSEYSSLQ